MTTTNTAWTRVALAALLAACLGVALPSVAQSPPPGGVTEVAVEHDDDHMMMTWLGVAMNDYANAMANWLLDAARHHGGPISQGALLRFQTQLRRATFAYFEYSYDVDGIRHSRIYLAASGRAFETYIDARSPGLEAPTKPDADYFASDNVVRHASAGATPGSDVTAAPHVRPLPNRGNDAEIKALQSLMRDIDAGLVEPRGRLVGFVSKQPCDSCSAAMRQFAVETHSDVHINYVHGANEDGLRTPAWMALRQAREAIIADLVTMLTAPVSTSSPAPEKPVDDDAGSFSVCRRQ
jgi:hypothetical protein